jgi:site-specific DNA recombinase
MVVLFLVVSASAQCLAAGHGEREVLCYRLIASFDEPDSSDTEVDRDAAAALTRQLKTRFAGLEIDRRNKANELAALEAQPPRSDHQIKLIDRLPQLQARLSEMPERLQRELYDAFQLEIHYNPGDNTALIRVSMADDNIDGLTRTGEAIAAAQTKTQTDSNAGQHTGTGFPGAPSAADLVCAPNGVRTKSAPPVTSAPTRRLIVETRTTIR